MANTSESQPASVVTALSGETRSKFISALRRTFETVASDLLEVAKQEGLQTLTREDAISAAVDYLYMYGQLSKEELKIFQEMAKQDRQIYKDLCQEAFPYHSYS